MAEFDVFLDAPPYDQGDQEVIVTFTPLQPSFNNDNVFYTDSNGMEMQRREWNKQPTYEYHTNSTTASNYYPVTSAIAIVDDKQGLQFTVMNDRA